jgi:2'-5' RNA ligase
VSEPTETAVVVPVPPAEPVIGVHRTRLDQAAGWGVPAHVTVLYPFVAPDRIDDEVLAALRRAVGTVPAFDAVWRRTGWFEQGVLWLAPEPAEPFRALTAAVVREFPDHPPFGGVYPEVVPHLTVANGAPMEEMRAAERAIRPLLPFAMRVVHVQVLAGTTIDRSWRVLADLPLGRAGSGPGPEPR